MSQTHRVTLTIKQKDAGFSAWMRSDQHPNETEISLDVNRERLRELNRELLENLAVAIGRISSLHFGVIEDMAQHEISERFRWLARLGHGDLRQIFPEKLLSQIRTDLNPGAGTVLEIVSRDFLFPWELLYDADEDDEFRYENFWGFKYVIYRHMPRSGGGSDPEIEVKTNIVSVGLLADMDLSSVATVEVPFLRATQRIMPKEFPCNLLNKTQRDSSVKMQLLPFFANSFDIIHFACHTRQSWTEVLDVPVLWEPRDEYCIQLSRARDFCIWPRDFLSYPIPFGNNPLVVLNACGTRPRDPLKTGNMVSNLCRVGARGVITTECDVPDILAAAFTQRFYPLALDGKELGQALLETRKHYLGTPYHNPFGLLYALYAPPGTRFILPN